MFRRVALITFANVLVINQILLTNKQMICRHLTFTFHFYFSGILSEFLKRTTPPGCFPPANSSSRWCGIWWAAPPPTPWWSCCWRPPTGAAAGHFHLHISQGPACPDGVERTSTNHRWYHTPTPLTGCIKMLQPCRNSSLEFILISGSRFAILTPSFAFLLCGLEKNWVNFIWKWENIGTTITPLCFSKMCFHNGECALFFSTSLTWFSPRLKRFLPVSPAYLLVTATSPQTMQKLPSSPSLNDRPKCTAMEK